MMKSTHTTLKIITAIIATPILLLAFYTYTLYSSKAEISKLQAVQNQSVTAVAVNCKKGLANITMSSICINSKTIGYLGANYTCLDGSKGSFTTKSCLTYVDLKDAASNSCRSLSKCDALSPTPPVVCKNNLTNYSLRNNCNNRTDLYNNIDYVCSNGDTGTLGDSLNCLDKTNWEYFANLECIKKSGCLTPTPTPQNCVRLPDCYYYNPRCALLGNVNYCPVGPTPTPISPTLTPALLTTTPTPVTSCTLNGSSCKRLYCPSMPPCPTGQMCPQVMPPCYYYLGICQKGQCLTQETPIPAITP